MSDSETTYRFGGDASGLLAELTRVRAELDKTAGKAQETGAVVQSSVAKPAGADAFVASLQQQASEIGKTKTEMLSAKAAQLGVTEETKAYIQQISDASKATHEFGFSTARSKTELLVLAHEMAQGNVRRFGTSLMVLGEQTGVAGALFSTLGLAIIGAVGALGVFAYGVFKGWQESDQLNKSLQLTHNYAGLTADGFRNLAATLSTASGQSIHTFNSALQEVVSTGRFTGASLGVVTSAVVNLSRLSGQSAEEIVKDFAKMADGVAKWAVEHNKQYHYLTGAQLEYIKALESQGKTEEAVAFNMKLVDAQIAKQVTNLGFAEKAWNAVKGAASGAWDSILGLGRETTVGDKLAQASKELAQLEALRASKPSAAGMYGEAGDAHELDATIGRQRVIVAELKKEAADKKAAAEQDSKDAVANAKAIEDLSSAHQQALSGLSVAGMKKRIALNDLEREKTQIALDKGYELGEVSLKKYVDTEYQLRKAALADKLKLLDAEAGAESGIKPGSPNEKIAQQTKLLDIEARRLAVRKELLALGEKYREGDKEFEPKKLLDQAIPTAQQSFNAFEHKADPQTEASIRAAQELDEKNAHDLIALNEKTTDSLIKDERTRGMELIALEEEAWRKKLDIAGQSIDQQRLLEDELAKWRVNKEKELTDKLRPQWEKQLDEWRNHNRLMRDTYNEFQDGWLKQGEQAWVTFLQTGKINLKSFADFALQEFAKMQFKDQIGDAFSKVGGMVAGLFGIKSPDAGVGGAGDTASRLSNTSALQTSTVTINLFTEALQRAAAAAAGAGGSGGSGGFLAGLFGGGGTSGATAGAGAGSAGDWFASAKGNAFGFAKGGAFTNRMFDSPTMFRFASGGGFANGVMGEAGPEAVVPLKRGPGGALGVAAHGMGAAPTVIINAPPGAQVDRTETRQGANGTEVEAWLSMAENHIAGRVAQGRGPVIGALQKRGVSTDRNLPRVG